MELPARQYLRQVWDLRVDRRCLGEGEESEGEEGDHLRVRLHGLLVFVGCWFLSGSVSGSCLGDDAIVFVMPVPPLALDMPFARHAQPDAQMLGQPLSPSREPWSNHGFLIASHGLLKMRVMSVFRGGGERGAGEREKLTGETEDRTKQDRARRDGRPGEADHGRDRGLPQVLSLVAFQRRGALSAIANSNQIKSDEMCLVYKLVCPAKS